MSYSQFTLASVKKNFDLTTSEETDIFASVSKIECSEYLAEMLQYNVPLALASNTEKARSEMIITPILIELKKQLNTGFNLFSGIEFEVEPEKGLTGYCDFILSRSLEKLFVAAPVVTLVEAKNENIKGGLGQCIAEMVAAQLFNEREGNKISTIYGVVTTGTTWQFMKLTGKVVEIELKEYYLTDIDKILGILVTGIQEQRE
ncbi:hypothetical protein PN36_16685 [Candidatus Thiomargarita nelsonii]|uniref:Uncharacterized protein n=1 Tax=Candidatus Thiomargarita nelsonii TaxID=1003181 RepID=A0A0A6PIC4_9GAMM|nr:hypothetical protein PN36_16685 [Candidatus Thiomargarita nelsonii]